MIINVGIKQAMAKAYGYINITSAQWLVKRIGEKRFHRLFSDYKPGRLLDIGCGSGEKRSVIPEGVHYIGLDHPGTQHDSSKVSIFGSAFNLPFQQASFDSVFCTGVLEHLEEPEVAIREAFRILVPKGRAIYTVPLFWHLHEEPRDFYRYTNHILRYLFTKAGFKIERIEPLSGFWITFGSAFNYYIERFAKGPLRYPIGLWVALNNLLFLLFDRIDRPEAWTWMYLVIAVKPDKSISE